MKTYKITGTMGVVSGYGHNNEVENPVVVFGKTWQAVAERYFNDTGVYVGVVAKEARIFYSPNWGCPNGGEVVVEYSTECNPTFANPEDWKEVAEKIIKEVKDKLGQKTTQHTIDEVEYRYVADSD